MSAVCCALRRRTFAMTAEFRQVPRFSMAISGTADAIGAAKGNVRISRNGAEIESGQLLFQGLTLEKGKYSFTVDASGDGEVKIIGSGDNKTVASKKVFKCPNRQNGY